MAIRVNNIFDLVGRFGAEEDRLTASFGHLLKNDKSLFRAFMKLIGIPEAGPPRSYDILTQPQYKGFRQDNRVDLEITRTFDTTCLVESKIGGNKFDESQLRRYARFLIRERKERRDKVRLVLITYLNERERFRKFAKRSGLNQQECVYLRWDRICRLVEEDASSSTTNIRDQFLERMRHRMSDKKVINGLPGTEVEEVMIVTVNPENLRLARSKKIYRCQNENPRRSDARYIAFYATKGPKAITDLARVRETELNVLAKDELHKYYRLEKPVRLREPIPLGKKPPRFAVRYTTLDQLVNALTTDDII